MKKIVKVVVLGVLLGQLALLGGCAKRCHAPCEPACGKIAMEREVGCK